LFGIVPSDKELSASADRELKFQQMQAFTTLVHLPKLLIFELRDEQWVSRRKKDQTRSGGQIVNSDC